MARIRTACVVLTLLFAGQLAAQTDWNAAHDWTANANPSGAWSYGYKTGSATAGFAVDSIYLSPATAFPQRDEWTAANNSAVMHNLVGFGGDIPTNMLLLLPDPAGNLAVVRWTAPTPGSYVLQGQFNALGASHAQVTVVSNGSTSVVSQALSGGSSSMPFTVYVNAASGATVDFDVAGGSSDATGLNVTVHTLQLNRSGGAGAATLQPFTKLQMTDAQFEAATVWTTRPQWVADGFDTSFTYSIPAFSNPPADGFSFTLHNDPAGAAFLGDGGGALAMNNLTHALVVEFDDFNNDSTDGPSPHLAVLTAGAGPMNATPECSPAPCTATAGGYTITTLGKYVYPAFSPWFSSTHQVRLKYIAGATPVLYAYLDAAAGGHGVTDGSAPVLTMPVNLQSLLALPSGTATIGFTGGTGWFWQQVQISSWQFASMDITPPVVGSLANFSLEANDLGGAHVSFTAPTATDAQDGSRPVNCNPASGSLFPVGSTVVTCSASDLSGNVGQSSFTVKVTDTTPPTLSLPTNITAEATSGAGAAVSYVATATDIVDGNVTPSCLPASGSTFPLGTTAVTCTATDAHQNSASASFHITVQDTTPPTISGMPASLTLEATGPSGAVASWKAPTASDLVDGSDPVVCSAASGSTFPLGTTTVNCTATDAHQNSASASFNVTVRDTTPPAISGMPASMTLEATGPSGAVANWAAPTATDLVDGSVAVLCSAPSGSTFPLGMTTVTCTATDAHQNSASAGFSITVRDTTPPALSLPANMTVNATSGSGANVSFTATATDLVNGTVPVVCSPASGSLFPIATTTVQCSATDAHGNTATGSFSVTVKQLYNVALLYNPNHAEESGSAYPILLQVMDSAGHNVSSASLALQATGVLPLGDGTPGPLASEGRANPGMFFRYDPELRGYVFNLKLKGYSAGAFDLMFNIGSTTGHAAPFAVRAGDNRGR